MKKITKSEAEAPMTQKQLAGLYNVSYKTIRTWLKPHKHIIGTQRHLYTPAQLRTIYSLLGYPNTVDLDSQ